ncbi:hypothetical protein AMATHDRAFT_48740 [Amanita thiersii Skay4041]|uniref:Uncharacterized protein n=1 Tax=Amanita thiersii Skay4041 TaxID=703135 RepID=A0A2A9NP09_9AGAR|nr:hypothetical protein AMATHDRAFT_48740 [Amanita thiersii Skay4041]
MYTAFVAVAAFASLFANAMPTQLISRQTNNTIPVKMRFFTCTEQYFGGDCAFQQIKVNSCQMFPQEFQDSISSLRPDPGFNCTIFTTLINVSPFSNADCSGDNFVLSYPFFDFNSVGIDWGTLPDNVNDKTKSFECVNSGFAPN